MGNMNINEDNLSDLAHDVREHVDEIDQNTENLSFYVVGGAVRDALMDRTPNDLDFVVTGETPERMMRRGFEDIQATSFPVFMDSEGMEWALARTENKTGDGYHGFEIETEDVTLMEDLGRRDLRINAMALDVFADTGRNVLADRDEWELLGRAAGRELQDIEEERLHPVGSAFKQDPIRVLRLSRYAARFPNFEPTDRAISMSRQIAYELNRCSRERIGDEIVKAMEQADEPRRFWEVLRDTGALAVVFPELDRATLVPAGPEAFHAEGDTFTHTMMVVDQMYGLCQAQKIEGDARVRRLLMAVAHDIGKVIVADEKGGLLSDPPERFGGHAEIGASHIPHIAQSMGLEKQYGKAMQDAAEYHMDFYDVKKTLDVENHEEDPYSARWAQSFLSNFDHEHDPNVSTIYGATPDEMLDLTHADHEGRLEYRGLDHDEHGVFQADELFDMDDTDGIETHAVRPEFDREPYERVMDAVYGAIGSIDGYVVMREGLCEASSDVPDEDLRETLERCDDCESPGPWIGERIEQLTKESIIEDLEGDE